MKGKKAGGGGGGDGGKKKWGDWGAGGLKACDKLLLLSFFTPTQA